MMADKGITVYCPCCGNKAVVPFEPVEGLLHVAMNKRCAKCKKIFRIELNGELISIRGGWTVANHG